MEAVNGAQTMNELTSKQASTLREFRNAVSDILTPKHDDHFLLKWLIARKFNIHDAETMIRKSFAWRKQFGADSLLDYKPPEVLEYYWKIKITSHDKEGCPILFIRYGRLDIKGIFQAAKKADVIRYSAKILESVVKDCEEQTRKLGRYIGRLFVLFDMDGFSLRQFLYKPAFDYSVQCLVLLDSNYPELLKNVIIINAPPAFSIAFALVKPFLHERTLQKIQLYGKDGWQETLLYYIHARELPALWGGTKRGPNDDPCCPDEVCPGGPVPKSYYISSNAILMDENAETVYVAQKSSSFVEVSVLHRESSLSWEFQTQKHDIAFGLFYKLGEDRTAELEEIIPVERVNSHMIPEQGKIICTKAGTYVLKFDNTFSVWRSKTVKYNIEVKPPPGLH